MASHNEIFENVDVVVGNAGPGQLLVLRICGVASYDTREEPFMVTCPEMTPQTDVRFHEPNCSALEIEIQGVHTTSASIWEKSVGSLSGVRRADLEASFEGLTDMVGHFAQDIGTSVQRWLYRTLETRAASFEAGCTPLTDDRLERADASPSWASEISPNMRHEDKGGDAGLFYVEGAELAVAWRDTDEGRSFSVVWTESGEHYSHEDYDTLSDALRAAALN